MRGRGGHSGKPCAVVLTETRRSMPIPRHGTATAARPDRRRPSGRADGLARADRAIRPLRGVRRGRRTRRGAQARRRRAAGSHHPRPDAGRARRGGFRDGMPAPCTGGARAGAVAARRDALRRARAGGGARGYLMKGEELDGVVDALAAIMRGEIVLSPRMNARVLARCFHGAADGRYSGLSNREMQIFLLIGAGRSTGEIAAELGLSPKTVGAHREHIKTKLGLATAVKLEREALLHVERME